MNERVSIGGTVPPRGAGLIAVRRGRVEQDATAPTSRSGPSS